MPTLRTMQMTSRPMSFRKKISLATQNSASGKPSLVSIPDAPPMIETRNGVHWIVSHRVLHLTDAHGVPLGPAVRLEVGENERLVAMRLANA